MLSQGQIKEALSDGFLKTSEDWEAAGRIAARAYQDEMTKLCAAFGVETAATGKEASKVDVSNILAELGIES
jgi:hypothetical protein